LARGQPTGHGRACAGRKRRVDRVDIERDIDATLADALAKLGTHAGDAVVRDVLGRAHDVITGARDRIVLAAAARTTPAELEQLAPLDQPLGDRVAQRRSVMKFVTPRLGSA